MKHLGHIPNIIGAIIMTQTLGMQTGLLVYVAVNMCILSGRMFDIARESEAEK